MPLPCMLVSKARPCGSALEAVDRLDVVEEERQVEDLHLARVLLELGQGRRQHLHVAQQQRLHFLAVAEQRRVGIDVYLDPAAQALFDEFLEQQRAWPLGVFSATTWENLMTIGCAAFARQEPPIARAHNSARTIVLNIS